MFACLQGFDEHLRRKPVNNALGKFQWQSTLGIRAQSTFFCQFRRWIFCRAPFWFGYSSDHCNQISEKVRDICAIRYPVFHQREEFFELHRHECPFHEFVPRCTTVYQTVPIPEFSFYILVLAFRKNVRQTNGNTLLLYQIDVQESNIKFAFWTLFGCKSKK